MKKNKLGRPLKYRFDLIPAGKRRTLKVDNPRSCQSSAHIYASKHGLVFETVILPNVGIRIYNATMEMQ